MNLLSIGINRTASVVGVVGLSAIALLGNVKPASAVVVKGSDYWITQQGSTFSLGGFNIDVVGNPIGTFNGIDVGNADTIVERKKDVVFSSNGSGQTDIEVVALSLKSQKPVNYNGSDFDVFVGLTQDKKSLGKLIINKDHTFSSNFDVFWTAMFKPTSGGDAIDCPFASCSDKLTLKTTGRWTGNLPSQANVPTVEGLVGNISANVHKNLSGDQTGFFPGFSEGEVVSVTHDSTGWQHHIVGIVPNARKDRLPRPPAPPTPTPEPLTTLGLAVGVGFGGFFRRKYSRKLN